MYHNYEVRSSVGVLPRGLRRPRRVPAGPPRRGAGPRRGARAGPRAPGLAAVVPQHNVRIKRLD